MNNPLFHLTGPFAFFALFANYKGSVFSVFSVPSVPSVANYINDPVIPSRMTLRFIRATYVGAALAANSI